MNATIAKALILLLLTGTLVTAVCHRSARSITRNPHPADDWGIRGPGIASPPDTAFLRPYAKVLIADDVIARRRSLLEAAALFGALNRLPPEAPAGRGHYTPLIPSQPRTDEEDLCRQVIGYVNARHDDLSTRHDALARAKADVARLESEYREESRKYGVIRLPDPSTLVPAEKLIDAARAALGHLQQPGPPTAASVTRP